MVGQGHVDDPTLVGRHGLESDGASIVYDPLRDTFGHVRHGVVPSGLVAFDVDHQIDPCPQTPTGKELHDKLERLQGLAASSDQEARVLALNLEYGAIQVLVVGLFEVRRRLDVHLGKEVPQDIGGGGDHLVRRLQKRDAHPGRLAPEAEQPGLSSTNDVDFYVGPICVELP